MKMALEDCDSSPEKRQGRKRRAASSTDQENASPFKKQCEEKHEAFPFPISIGNTYVPHIATRVFRSMENFSTENLLRFRSVSKCWKEGHSKLVSF